MADLIARLPDEVAPEAHIGTQGFYEATSSQHHAGSTPPASTKVGWTLRNAKGDVVDAMAFLINPQGIDRAHGSRSQLFATKAAFLVDNFGPAPTTIQLRQLVGQGKELGNGIIFTTREDVQRFVKTIWLPAISDTGPVRHVYFHDNHLERGFEELVWFPGEGSLSISRDVSQGLLWAINLTMISLEKNAYADVEVNATPVRGRRYQVRHGDTLTKLVSTLAGAGASAAARKKLQAALLVANPRLRKRRAKPGGGTVAPLKLIPGEYIRLP